MTSSGNGCGVTSGLNTAHTVRGVGEVGAAGNRGGSMGRTTVHDVAVLGRGSHLHPGKGACLLELTSTLPGGRWTDHPAAVDPVLAALARAVNDYTSDGARRALVPLAP